MCDCIKNIEKKILDVQPLPNRKIIKAKVAQGLYQSREGRLEARPVIRFDCRVEGYKAYKQIDQVIEYCPFCGEKYM